MPARSYRLLKLEDFSGGLNLRDAPSEVGDTEASDAWNITCDERGGIVKRLGRAKYNLSAAGGPFKYLFYCDEPTIMIGQIGAALYTTDGSGVWSGPIKTFSTADRIAACNFLKTVVMIHPVDGVFTYDGTTFSGRVANSPIGNCITPWQNCIWTGGEIGSKTRLTRSDIGLITWPTAVSGNLVTVDFRDRDEKRITALAISQGLDTQGRPGLLVFKEDSIHRVYNSSTGAYTTLSTDAGASGPMCVTSLYGTTGFINRRGIYTTDGLSTVTLASEKIEPIFTPQQLKYSTCEDWCAGVFRDRFVFGVNRTVANSNDMLLEYHPTVGWIVPHSLPTSCMATWVKNDRVLYSGSPTSNYVYSTFKGWSDDGNPITSRWQSRWFEPVAGYELRLRRLLVSGRGIYNLFVKPNYTLGAGVACPVSIISRGVGSWNDDTWNDFEWGPTGYEDYQSFYSLGHARSVAFALSETSTTSVTGPSLLVDGASSEVGSFAMYGLHLDYVPLTPA
jgi:hypothetical protein